MTFEMEKFVNLRGLVFYVRAKHNHSISEKHIFENDKDLVTLYLFQG